ncbi:MAG: AzlD domain-containing protein [Pseudomonadota bacterium]
MFYNSVDAWWWPFIFILLAGALPTAMWRWAGVLLVGNLSNDSEWIVFIRCIATSLVAAVIAQLVFFPSGTLAEMPMFLRLGAALGGFAAFLLLGRRMILGVLAGEALLITGYFLS